MYTDCNIIIQDNHELYITKPMYLRRDYPERASLGSNISINIYRPTKKTTENYVTTEGGNEKIYLLKVLHTLLL